MLAFHDQTSTNYHMGLLQRAEHGPWFPPKPTALQPLLYRRGPTTARPPAPTTSWCATYRVLGLVLGCSGIAVGVEISVVLGFIVLGCGV